MGMAAPQARLLALTNRQTAIGVECSLLGIQQQALARDMKNISQKYSEALSQKVYKWTNNGGATYTNLSYNALMTPNTTNQNNNYLITDLNGKVVVSNKYQKYAEMISPDGKGGAGWDGDTRYKVLAQATGISEDDLRNKDNLYLKCCQTEEALNKAEAAMPQKNTYAKKCSKIKDFFIEKTKLVDGNKYEAKTIIDALGKLTPYFGSTESQDKYKAALAALSSDISNSIESKSGYYEGGKLDIDTLIDMITELYRQQDGDVGYTNEGDPYMLLYDPNQYDAYKSKYDEWKPGYDNAEKAFKEASEAYDTLFTADEKRMIEFYDTMFASIAEKGWVYNENIDDSSYLNEMLENNQYLITTVERSSEYDSVSQKCISENSYSDTIASNFSNLIAVYDEDARVEAQAEYEYQKSLINAKETRIDTRKKNLETEQSAIKQMIQSIEDILKNNTESLNIFT